MLDDVMREIVPMLAPSRLILREALTRYNRIEMSRKVEIERRLLEIVDRYYD